MIIFVIVLNERIGSSSGNQRFYYFAISFSLVEFVGNVAGTFFEICFFFLILKRKICRPWETHMLVHIQHIVCSCKFAVISFFLFFSIFHAFLLRLSLFVPFCFVFLRRCQRRKCITFVEMLSLKPFI